MTTLNFTKLHVRAAAGSVTGSIQRVCAADESNASTLDNWVTGIFKSLVYGAEENVSIHGTEAAHTGSQNEVHQIGTQNIDILPGKCVDGPFIAIGTDADPTLIYYRGGLTIAND